MIDDLVKRLRATCSCNIDDTPCLAEEECRVAQEAADRIKELEAKLDWVLVERDETFALMLDRAQTAEAKLAKAVEERDEALNQLDSARHSVEVLEKRLAELTGGQDE